MTTADRFEAALDESWEESRKLHIKRLVYIAGVVARCHARTGRVCLNCRMGLMEAAELCYHETAAWVFARRQPKYRTQGFRSWMLLRFALTWAIESRDGNRDQDALDRMFEDLVALATRFRAVRPAGLVSVARLTAAGP